MAYHTSRAPTNNWCCKDGKSLLAWPSSKREKVLQERVNSLKIERDWYLKELKGEFILLIGIRAIVETFRYPDSFVKKDQSLMQEVKKKDEALALAQTTLKKLKSALIEVTKEVYYSLQTVEEMK